MSKSGAAVDFSDEAAIGDVAAIAVGTTHRYDKAYAWERLRAPFAPDDIEWRVARSGLKGKDVWAMVLAYITNRAVMDRLDEVFGPCNWRNEYAAGPSGGIVCGLSVRIGDEWVTKWDGAEETDIEKVKGGLSGAMKRAAVQWGIGRYLYDLPDGWANVHDKGKHRDKVRQKDGPDVWFNWDPPELPSWARPKPTKSKPEPVPNDTPDAPKPASKTRSDKRSPDDWIDHLRDCIQDGLPELKRRWLAFHALREQYTDSDYARVERVKDDMKLRLSCSHEGERDPDGDMVCVHCGEVLS